MVTIPLSSTRGNILSFTITIFLNESEILRKGRLRDKFNLSVFIFLSKMKRKMPKYYFLGAQGSWSLRIINKK